MAATELKLQVGLDLAFFRQQLAQLASATVGYSLPINIDRLAIQKEITKLGKNISNRKYTLKIDTTVKSAASDINNLQKALEGLEKKSVNIQITGTGNLNAKEAKKIRTALKTSVLANGGKIEIPATIKAAITQGDIRDFKNAVKSKLTGLSVNVKANVQGKGFAETEHGYAGVMQYMQKEGLLGKTASGMTGQMRRNGDDIKQQLSDAVKSAEKIKSIFDGVAKSIATTGKSTANVQGKRLGLTNVPLMAGGVERRIERSTAAIGKTLSADALKALYPEVSKTIASFVALKGQIQQNTSKLSGFSLILGLAAFAGVPLAKSVVKLTGSANSFAKLLDELGLKLDTAFTKAAFNILSATSGRMLSGGSVAGLLPAAYRGIGPSAGTAGLLPPAYRGIGASRNAGALPPAYRGLPAAYRGIGPSAGPAGLLPAAYRGIAGAPVPRGLGGTAFGAQKYLPTALGNETKKVLRDAAHVFLDTIRQGIREVKIQDFGNAVRTALPQGPQARSPLMLPPAGGTSAVDRMRISTGAYVGQPSFMRAPSMPPSMAPPNPPTPPGGGRGGFGSFGGLGGAMPNISLPGAGLVKELGDQFGYAAQQVLLFGTTYKALAFLTDFPSKVGEAVAQLQTFRNTLTAVTGGGQEFGKSNQFILDLVEKYNIPLQSARDGFSKLYASMAPAGFKGDEIRNIFTGISQGAATFGMSADKVDRVNYAFAQMASKGQVMSEELKGQLGDVLPGAVAIFAEAAGFKGPDALVKFTKAMEDGQYKGEAMKQLLINVGIVMKKEFGPGAEGAARTFQGIMNRMQNATTKLYETFEPMAIGFANKVILPMADGLKIAADGFNAFFTGQQATTKGGAELASKLQELKPTFEGLANNIQSVINRVIDLGKVFLPLLEVGARLLSSPLIGTLAQIYVSVLLVNGAFSMLAATGIARTVAALAGSLIPATQQSTFLMYRLTLATRGMWLAMTGPVGLAVLAIAAVTAALYAMHEPSREYLNTVPDRFADFWRDIASQAGASGRKVQKVWQIIQDFFGTLIKNISKAFQDGMNELPPFAKNAVSEISSNFTKLESMLKNNTENITKNWKRMIVDILELTNPVLKIAKMLGVDIAGTAINAATKEQPTKIETEPYTVAGIKYDRQTGRPIGQSLTPYTDANPKIPLIPGADKDDKKAAAALASQQALANKLSADQTKTDIERQKTLFENAKSMIEMEYDLREARANSFQKETIRFQRELFNIEMKRQKAVLDANNAVTKAQGAVAGGTGMAGLTKYITGDPSQKGKGYQADHGTIEKYHDHLAFATRELAVEAFKKLTAADIKVTEFKGYGKGVTGPHSGAGSLHHQGLAFDVPGYQWGGAGAIGAKEYAGSARVRQVMGIGGQAGAGGKVTPQQKAVALASQQTANALQNQKVKLTYAEVAAVKEAEIATANYVASILPVAEQELQNTLLQRRIELMNAGIKPDQIDTEMKIYEAQQKQTIGIRAAQKEIERVNKLKDEGKMSSEDAARAIANEQRVIDDLTKDLDPYTKAIRQAALANKGLAISTTLKDLENRAQMARALTPEAEMKTRLQQQGYAGTQLETLFEAEKTTTKAEQLKTTMQGVASTIGDAFSTAFQGIINGSMSVQDALGGMFQSIGQSFIKMAADIIAQQVVMITLGFIMKALGLIGGIASAGNAAGSAAFSPSNAAGLNAVPGQAFSMPQLSGMSVTGATVGTGFTTSIPSLTAPGSFGFAKGGAFSKGMRRFAHGGIVNGPTLFPFADGGAMQMGLMGEAGAEAIMPLQRGPDGSLGVRAAMNGGGMGSSSSPILNMNFETSTINGVEYVSRDQLEAAMAQTRRQASSDGAKRGMAMTLDKIQQSPQTRRRIGM